MSSNILCFCKTLLEIVTLFSTALVQLCAVLLCEDRWEGETAALFYVSFCFPLDSQQGFHLRTGLCKLCISASSTTEAAAALDSGFLNQLKKLPALLVIHSTICGNLLWVKTKLPQIRLLLTDKAAFPLLSEGTFYRRSIRWRWADVLCQDRSSELKKNCFTFHCGKGEGNLVSYACPSWG